MANATMSPTAAVDVKERVREDVVEGVEVSEDVVLFPYAAELVSIAAMRAEVHRVPLRAYPIRRKVDVTKTDNLIAMGLSI